MGRLLVLFVIMGVIYIGSEAVGAARRLLAPPDDPAARTATATRTMRKPTTVETTLRRAAESNPEMDALLGSSELSESEAALVREVATGLWSGPSRLDTRQIADKVFTLTNTARSQHGLPALRRDGAIDQIALGHSTNMARSGTLSHVDSRGNDATARAVLSGYPCRKPQPGGAIKYGLAENIAKHPRVISWKKKGAGAWRVTGWHSETELASRLVDRWMDSPRHRENILSPTIDRIGIGIAVKDETSFTKPNEWVMATQNFC